MSLEIFTRELTWGSKEKPQTEVVHIREMTGGDQIKLSAGQKYKGNPKKGEVEVDVGSNVSSRQLTIELLRVNEDGSKFYKNAEAVRAEPARKLTALSKLIDELNKNDDDEAEPVPGETKETPEGNA